MKTTSCCALLVLLQLWVTPILTFDIRGAAERVLAYYAYLADDISAGNGTPDTRSIAVGCKGAGGGRCNFNEFCIFIDDRPKVPNFNLLSSSDDFLSRDVYQMIKDVDAWRGPNGEKMTKMITASKLVSGAPDFNEALKGLGPPVAKLSAMADSLPDGAEKDNAQKIISGGRKAARDALLLRRMDHDKVRFIGLQKILSQEKPPIKLVRKAGPAIGSYNRAYQMISRQDTVNGASKHADPGTALKNAVKQYNSADTFNRRHYNTLSAMEHLQKSIACTK